MESIKTLIGNSQYEGYGVDLIKELAEKLGFNFTFHNGGNDYGSFNKSTNLTTGFLKEIVEGVSGSIQLLLIDIISLILIINSVPSWQLQT